MKAKSLRQRLEIDAWQIGAHSRALHHRRYVFQRFVALVVENDEADIEIALRRSP